MMTKLMVRSNNCLVFFLSFEHDNLDETITTQKTRQASSAVSVPRPRSTTVLTNTTRRKREQQNENMQLAITELLNHFSHRNLDAIIRVIKMTLEKLRKRITSTLSYGKQFDLLFLFCDNSISSRS